jgi:hypothetical protein
MISSEAMAETEAFVSLVQRQFEQGGGWDMAALELGLRKALFSDGCKILEGLLNQPGFRRGGGRVQNRSGKADQAIRDVLEG